MHSRGFHEHLTVASHIVGGELIYSPPECNINIKHNKKLLSGFQGRAGINHVRMQVWADVPCSIVQSLAAIRFTLKMLNCGGVSVLVLVFNKIHFGDIKLHRFVSDMNSFSPCLLFISYFNCYKLLNC